MSILDEIYTELYLEKEPDTEEYKELKKRNHASWKKAAEILGGAFSDEVWNNLMAMTIAESRHDFKEGFRLGVQLMIEAQSSPMRS